MSKFRFIKLLFCFFCLTATAQNQKFSRVKVWIGDVGMKSLSSLGIETDHGDYRKNVWFISDFSEDVIIKIASAGFRYDVLITDVKEHYRQQAAAPVISRIQA